VILSALSAGARDPASGCDIRMFIIRPIAPAGGRRRKNTRTRTGSY
jgi:hypothetical protein